MPELAAHQLGVRRLTLRPIALDNSVAPSPSARRGPAPTPAHRAAVSRKLDPDRSRSRHRIHEPVGRSDRTAGRRAKRLRCAHFRFGGCGGGHRGGSGPLLDRLANRLGAKSIMRPIPVESHIPERAVTWVPPLDGSTPAAWPQTKPRPIRLAAAPEPIDAMAPVPDDPPLSFRWRHVLHRVRRADGPERIAPEWWRVEDEGAETAITTGWKTKAVGGWLYRAGLYQPAPIKPMAARAGSCMESSADGLCRAGRLQQLQLPGRRLAPQELALTAASLGHPGSPSPTGIPWPVSSAPIRGLRRGEDPPYRRCAIGIPGRRGAADLSTDRAAYGRLCELLTLGRRRAPKSECHLAYADLRAHRQGQIVIALPPEDFGQGAFRDFLSRLKADFPRSSYFALSHLYRGDDAKRLHRLQELADGAGRRRSPSTTCAITCPERRVLMDVLTCVKEHCTIDTAGYRLLANAERHLKPEAEMRRLFRGYEAAVDRTMEIADRCRFSLGDLKYEYPRKWSAPTKRRSRSPTRLAWEGAAWRYPEGVPEKVKNQIEHELALIARLDYAPHFLTVHDIVRFAREKDILHQGRGSAANSTVCYCLGVTAVNPAKADLLFERFISEAGANRPISTSISSMSGGKR